MAGVDFGIKGTRIPAAPIAPPPGGVRELLSSVEDAEPLSGAAHFSCCLPLSTLLPSSFLLSTTLSAY